MISNFSEITKYPQLLNQESKWLDFGVYSTYFSISWQFWWNTFVGRWRCHQVAKKSQFLITFLDPDTPILIIPGCARYQKIAKAKTVNLRYFTSNSELFEGGKQPFVYKSEQMALLGK